MQIAEDYQAFNLGIGKDLGLFGAFSFDITQANTTLADDTRHSGQSVKSVYSKSFYQTGTNIGSQDIAILRKVFITYPTVHTVE